MAEILKSHFNETERKQVEGRIQEDSNFSEIYEKIKNDPELKLNALAERVEKTADTFEQRFDAFKKAVLEAEKKIPDISVAALKKEAEGVLEGATDDVVATVKEKIGFSAIFEKISVQISGLISKIKSIFSFNSILSALGIGWAVAAVLPEDKKTSELPVEGAIDQHQPEANNKKWEIREEENIWTEKDEMHYEFWKKSMKHFLNERFASSDNFWEVSDSLRKYSIKELWTLKFEDISVDQRQNFNKEQFEKFKNNVLWEDMKILYSNLLTKENLDSLLANPHIKDILDKSDIAHGESFDIARLTVWQLYILFSLVSIHIVGSWVSVMPWIAKGIIDKIFSVWEDMAGMEWIKEEMIVAQSNFEQNVISQKTWKELMMQVNNISENSSFYVNEGDLKNITDQSQLRKILEFRDFIQSDVIDNPKYNLEQQEVIQSAISFQDLLNLYVFLKWEEELDTFESSYIYVYIGNMLENKSGAYLKDLTELTLSETQETITNQEQELIKVLAKKALDKTWLDWIIGNAEKLSGAWIEHLKDSPEIIAWIAGIVALLRLTPVGRWVSVLYWLVWKKWMAFLASAGVFGYFYSQLPSGMQDEFKNNKEFLEEYNIDINELF